MLIWCSGELKDYQIIFHWQRWAEERPSEQTAVQTSALAEPATGTTDHKHEALTSNGTFPFIAGSELKQIGYQLRCFIYSLIMRGYNLQESELIHSSWCNLHLSIGYCLVNHHRMLWILEPIFWTSSQRPGFCMVSVWSLCVCRTYNPLPRCWYFNLVVHLRGSHDEIFAKWLDIAGCPPQG